MSSARSANGPKYILVARGDDLSNLYVQLVRSETRRLERYKLRTAAPSLSSGSASSGVDSTGQARGKSTDVMSPKMGASAPAAPRYEILLQRAPPSGTTGSAMGSTFRSATTGSETSAAAAASAAGVRVPIDSRHHEHTPGTSLSNIWFESLVDIALLNDPNPREAVYMD